MSFASRRQSGVSILSMLDLLFGLFGAMIVLAALLNFLRIQETTQDQKQFVFVEFQIRSDDLDLSNLFIGFTVRGEDSNRQIVSHEFRPWRKIDKPLDGYQVAASGQLVSAHVFLPSVFLDDLARPMIRPSLENIPYLDDTDDGSIDVFFVIRTAHNSCVDRIQGVTNAEVLAAEASALAKEPAPSLFEIIGKTRARLCADTNGPGLNFNEEVTEDGWLRLDYRPPSDAAAS